MSLNSLLDQLKQQKSRPDLSQWHPKYCGEMDLVIKADGQWFYQGTPFKRQRLVKLLSSVLLKEQNDYFLITPVEKIKIIVEDAPFVLTQWQWSSDVGTDMLVSTNVDDTFILNSEHPVRLATDDKLYVTVRDNLEARVHRNVYYQWIEVAQSHVNGQYIELRLHSGDATFCIGRYHQDLA
jgi:hypothetical protein